MRVEKPMPPEHRFEVDPPESVRDEISRDRVAVDRLVNEAVKFLEMPSADVDDMALARMFIERGHSEDLSYWLVREAEVRRAPR